MKREYAANTKEYVICYEAIDLVDMEILGVSEGCLIDNLLCMDTDGNIRIFAEKYLNCWTSGLIEICCNMTAQKKYDFWYEHLADEDEDMDD